MFFNVPTFDQKLKWDTSSVRFMNEMFSDATSFNQDLSDWNTSNVTDMTNMFYGATSFNQDLNDWNTSNVVSMNCMFYNAENFDQSLNNWNTSNVKNMSSMFYGAENFDKSLNNWNTSNVEDMSNLFYGAENFDSSLNNWDTSKVKDMSLMFRNALKFDQDLSDWDTSNVKYMQSLFYGAKNFNQDISNWVTSKVKDMSLMFYNALKFDQDLSNWDTSEVEDMNSMFYGANNFNQDLSNWVTSKVKDMSLMFYNCEIKIIPALINTEIGKEIIISKELVLVNNCFTTLDINIRRNLIISCKWYSYQIDGYLNSIYRNDMYPSAKLDNHIANLHDNAQTFLISSRSSLDYNFCKEVKSPFEDFVESETVQRNLYIEKIKQVTLFVHSIFTQYYYTLTSPIKVYRGMTIPISNSLSLNMTGVNSVSLDINVAKSFMFKMSPRYIKDKCENYLIQFELPVGAKVIPMKICSTVEEYEFVIINQGYLRIIKQEKLTRIVYDFIDEANEKVAVGNLLYDIITAEFVIENRLPVYGNFNV
jgi:surface protein